MVRNINFNGGANMFEAQVASNTDGGKIELYFDKIDGTLIETCNVSGTDGWQVRQKVSCEVANVVGKHDSYLKFTGVNGCFFNVDWWKFQKATGVKSDNLSKQNKPIKTNDFSKNTNAIRFNYNVSENFLEKI